MRRVLVLLAVAAALAGGCGADPPPPRVVVTPTATVTDVVAPVPEKPERPKRLTIGVTGDLLPHLPIVARALANGGGRAYDFRPMLRPIRSWVRGNDLAFCHVETPLTPATPTGYPIFNSPPALADAVRATGFDACSTASNHSVDQGQAGIDATRRSLKRARVPHTGTFSSARQQRRPLILRTNGIKVALLAYTQMTNGIPSPHPYSVNLAEPRRIVKDARRARRRGARVVIVQIHWGTEFQSAPDAFQRTLAARLAREPAITAVVGQHAHVVQPIRRVKGKWVVFGEGNLLSNQTAACCPAASQDGMLVRLHITVGPRSDRVERITYTPTWVRHPDYAVVRAHKAQPDSYARTVATVGRNPQRTLKPRP